MTKEEWDFSKHFGTTIIHIEMDELISTAEKFSDTDADKIIEEMKNTNRIGTVKTDEERIRHAAKVYLAVKALFERYDLSAAAAECYPYYSGLVNLPSSWLADEGLVLDTEGDIGHTLLIVALNEMEPKGPVALCEVGGIDDENSVLELAHEGSTAHSFGEEISKVHIQDCGDGTMVGVPFKTLPKVTMTHMCGTNGKYRMMIMKGATLDISHEKWITEGSKLLVRARVENASETFNAMMSAGLDHHILIKEGDVAQNLEDLCHFFDVEPVKI
jgi:L-arabinose isomerase